MDIYQSKWLAMKKSVFYLFVFLLLSACSTKQEPPIIQMSEQINNLLVKNQGTFAVAFEDLTTGDTLLVNAHEQFHAASTMKTPVMIELYKQAHEGKFALEDSIEVKNTFMSIVDGSPYTMDVSVDSETMLYDNIGKKLPISTLLYEMITKSSNLATNILIEKVGAKNVTATMRALGAPDINVLRGVEDQKAFDRGLNNTTTAYDLMKIFEAIGKHQIISGEACDAMTKILFDQHFNEIIPAKLPADVKIAHKTGSITGVHHDSGIVVLPNGHKYVLVLLSKDLQDADKGIEVLAEVSKLVYNYAVAEKDAR